jgi:hypothetical protein
MGRAIFIHRNIFLRTQNSELRTQNSELRTQNSELRTQNSELRTQNSEHYLADFFLVKYFIIFFSQLFSFSRHVIYMKRFVQNGIQNYC